MNTSSPKDSERISSVFLFIVKKEVIAFNADFFFSTKEKTPNHLKALNKTSFFEQDLLLPGQKNQMVLFLTSRESHSFQGINTVYS